MSPSDQDKRLALKKGAWTIQEDMLLTKCIETYGEGKWHLVPLRSGLSRCRKSCRLRWLNYLRPNLKKGDFGEDEIDLIRRLHKLLGNRWSLIAGRIPGRTGNDVKNYWNTHIRSSCSKQKEEKKHNDNNKLSKSATITTIIMPQPYSFSKTVNLNQQIDPHDGNNLIRMSNDAAVNNNVFDISSGSIVAPIVTHNNINDKYLETLYSCRENEIDRNFGWSFDGCIMDGKSEDMILQQEEGQVNLFNFPEEAMWDLLDSE